MAKQTKKDRVGGIPSKNVQAFERISFLHQAATLMSTIRYDTSESAIDQEKKNTKIKNWNGDPPGALLATSRYLNNNMKSITNKLVIRLDPSIKRSVCKRCETSLLPAITSSTRIKSKPVPTILTTCKICKTKRQFRTQKQNYQLFNDRPENILEKQEETAPAVIEEVAKSS